MKRLCMAAILPLGLAACGSANQLTPAPGEQLPVAPYGAEARPTSKQLLTPSTQARPERDTDLLKNSEKRQPDPFDLPPQ
ncbi:MAG: hypothetical protein ACTHMG_00130 [Sphingomonas sp.]